MADFSGDLFKFVCCFFILTWQFSDTLKLLFGHTGQEFKLDKELFR